MTTLTITDYLKYANLQMAAEAFLVRADGTVRDDIVTALKDGNNHASRFTQSEATKFAAEWRVVDQRANTDTGFSGTLFENTTTRELALSFRSTEFIDDAARDNEATNKLEIGDFGFAFGQLADMEAWYAELSGSGGALNGKSFSVTGYSLGGHLATAFNLMHPGAASQVVTFNGAGIGKIGNGSLADTQTKLPQMIAEFQTLRAQSDTAAGLEDKLTNLEVRATYRLIKAAIAANGGVPSESMLAMLPVTGGSEAALLSDALNTAIKIAKEAVRAPALTSGPGTTTGSPKDIQHQDIAGESLDYQLAVRLCAQKYDTSALNILVGGSNIWFGKTMGAWSSAVTNQWDLVGTETTATPTAMVANSQYHYGADTHVFIEDQPLYRGSAPSDMVKTSFANSGFKLLVAGYNQNDFGDTHSLVLIIDSLNVQNLLKTLAPSATQAQIETFFKAASAAKAESLTGSQGRCEGDVLETVLNALSQQLLGKDITKLDGKLEGNTWADFTDRSGFYERIKTLTADGGAFKNLTGKVTLALPDGRIATAARTDFAAFLALQTLSPFVLKALPGKESEVEALLRPSWETEYLAWNDDTQLTPEQRAKGEGTYTDLYLADRAAMLGWVTKAKLANTALNAESLKSSAPASQLQNAMWDFTDMANRISVTVSPSDWISINPDRRRVVFGGEENDNVNGYDKDDHIYGGTGTDTLDGGKGADYLEGNAGIDELKGGEGKDTLLGGAGDDLLEGGKHEDQLKGGKGNDTYVFKSGDGWDTLEDSDGQGSIKYDGIVLKGGKAVGDSGKVWQEETGGKTFTYILTNWSEGSETFQRLSIQGPDGGLFINRWQAGQLGLTLPGAEGHINVTTYSSTADAIYPNDIPGITADGREGNDLIISYARANTLLGNTGNDMLFGGTGNDTLEGGTGNDYLNGGAGNDTLEGGAGNDVVGFGNQRGIEGINAINWSWVADNWSWQRGSLGYWEDSDRMAMTFDVSIDGQSARFQEDGGPYTDGDIILGGDGNDLLAGAEGKDVVSGDGDDDWVRGNGGDDFVSGGGGRDEVWGDDGDDVLEGGAGNDRLVGSYGNDTLYGGADEDILLSDLFDLPGTDAPPASANPDRYGADTLHGGDGNDTLRGGGRDDTLYGDDGNDRLFGETDNDWLDGGTGADVLAGCEGNDWLYGGEGDDELYGDGDDIAITGQGDDVLYGEGGNDYLRGYAGNDIGTTKMLTLVDARCVAIGAAQAIRRGRFIVTRMTSRKASSVRMQ